MKEESRVFRAHHKSDYVFITASTDGEKAHEKGWRIGSDNWDVWMQNHPNDIIAIWQGMFSPNTLYWRLEKNGETVEYLPGVALKPWHEIEPQTYLPTLPEWAIKALIVLGEFTSDYVQSKDTAPKIIFPNGWVVPFEKGDKTFEVWKKGGRFSEIDNFLPKN